MTIDSSELENYVSSSILAIKKGIEGTGFKITNSISFDLAIINSSEGAAGFKIFIAKAEGKLTSNEVSHLRFEVKPDLPQIPAATYYQSNKINPAR